MGLPKGPHYKTEQRLQPHQWPSHTPESERCSIACQCLPASSCTQLASPSVHLLACCCCCQPHPWNRNAQFEADHVNDEVAVRCHARRGSRPSWRSGETTGNQLKYLKPAKELVKHVDQRFAQDPPSRLGLPDRSGGA